MKPDKATTPRKQPTQERSRQTFQAILQAAAQVFAEHGYGAGTTTRIAERAGVSVGSLYQYFPNKDALLLALLEHHVDESHRTFQAMLQDPGLLARPTRELIRRVVEAMIEVHMKDPELHRVMFEEVPDQEPVSRVIKKAEQGILRTVEGMIRSHPGALVSRPDLAAIVLTHTGEALAHFYVREGVLLGIDREAFTEEVTRLFHNYLAYDDG